MFNPKENNLLDEQLTVSGLQMNWVLEAGGAATSLFGGISASNQASKANKRNKKAQKEQQKLLNKQAKLQNDYNKKKYKADRKNYDKKIQYEYETALENWRYNTAVRAIQEATDAEKYLMNVKSSNKELTFNKLAEEQALTREQLTIQDARYEDAFERQDLLVKQLEAAGKASLGQAGRNRAKSLQSQIADVGRDIAVMDASLTGQLNESTLSMFDTRLERFAADARVEAARMLRPKSLPELPAPTKPPSPTWVKPMKVLPGMAAPAHQQSVSAPIIAGIGGAASALTAIPALSA